MRTETIIIPDNDDPSFQNISITAYAYEDEIEDGIRLGSLSALRHFEPDFHLDQISNYLWTFLDGESQELSEIATGMISFAHYFQEDVCEELEVPSRPGNGIIAITDVHVEPFARGKGIGKTLLLELARQHAGLFMFCGLMAYPYEIKRNDRRYKKTQDKLIKWYLSHESINFIQVMPKRTKQFLLAAMPGTDLESSIPTGISFKIP